MPTVEKTQGGKVYIRPLEQRFEIGDRVGVDKEMAAYLCEERGDFDRVDGVTDVEFSDTEGDETDGDNGAEAPFDPARYTVDELEEALEDGEYGGGELHALTAEEQRGKNRETALKEIKERIPGNAEA